MWFVTKTLAGDDVLVREIKKVELERPLVIAGFAGPGWAGAMAVNHIVEDLEMDEIADVRSRHVPPAAVFEGGRLRHPFRIHANKKRDMCAIICELPLTSDGLYSISSALLDWAEANGAREIVVLEGVPSPSPQQKRPVFCAAEEGKCEHLKKHGIEIVQKGFIGGMAGSLLNECLSRRVTGVVLLTPVTELIPDPQGAAQLIESVNKAYGLSIDTEELLVAADDLKRRLKEYVEKYEQTRNLEEKKGTPETMYA